MGHGSKPTHVRITPICGDEKTSSGTADDAAARVFQFRGHRQESGRLTGLAPDGEFCEKEGVAGGDVEFTTDHDDAHVSVETDIHSKP